MAFYYLVYSLIIL